ncbi:ABC transporter permease [Jidongwangia harbinensis]|uniref:ABC transporter permease n=1 Tax=Jidongwangia harbinensis TaxID=2878561 RepID=UPI001CD993F5|nr:ABC transporter permease [Jidongwangia harbinensis]MCA2215878.1 ABC transporter permease [Jidongwangia harbinensis]
MAYDETTYRRQTDDQSDPSAYRANGVSAADYRNRRRDLDPDDSGARVGENSGELLRRAPAQVADDDWGRDRLGVHIGWEIVLLLAAAAIGYLLYRLDPASMRRPALDTLLISGAALGALTLGAGLTLRAGVPNLAVGPIALAASLHFAENGDRGLVDAGVPALVVAAAGGLVVGLLVILLHVPGWVASLGAGLGVIVYIQLRSAPVAVQGAYDPSDQAFFLFGGFALLAVFGGALGTVTPIRRMLGRMRPVGDPARRRGASAALPVLGSLVLSSVFAVVAGILLAAQSTTPIVPGTGLEWTGIALGAALLAGTSAYGRRGGVFGTLLAVAGLTLFLDYAERRDLDIALFAVAAATLGAGLVVTRLVETYGRPLPVVPDDDWQATANAGTTTWSPDLPETWTPPASTENRSDRWDDGPWGAGR